MKPRHKVVLSGLVVLVTVFGILAFTYRLALLERYYLFRLESPNTEDPWSYAEKLEALGSLRVESWYIARLTEDPEWPNRVRASERLAELQAEDAIPALLALRHPGNLSPTNSQSQGNTRFFTSGKVPKMVTSGRKRTRSSHRSTDIERPVCRSIRGPQVKPLHQHLYQIIKRACEM